MGVARGDERGTTERVLTLLGLLQRRRVWSGPELAERLGVTSRTVRRDVERLRSLGYPVHAGQGVGGGYQLGTGKDLPPLLLDDEEAIATVVSLIAGAGAGTGAGGAGDAGRAGGAVVGSGEAALRALTKLDRVLPTRLRHEVRALSGSVESFGAGRASVDPEVLMTLARACRDEVEAGFDYPTGSSGVAGNVADSRNSRSGPRRRRVEPYRLVASDRRWYLLAYDLDRDDWRSFRVDRMTAVSARTWRFRPRAAPDAATYVQEGVASRVYPHRARFLVHASADTVGAQISASAAVVRPRGSERCEVLSGAGNLDVVLMHVLLLGHDFEILDPPELVGRCRALAERLLAAGATRAPGPDPDPNSGPDPHSGPGAATSSPAP
ncbi:helix-turn-helix transcriptional regulator [Embleya sp. NPDC001921]